MNKSTITLHDLVARIQRSFAELAPLEETKANVQRALDDHVPPSEIVESMREGLAKAGKKYEQGEFFLSDLIMSGMMAQEVSELLKPHLGRSNTHAIGKVVLATVKGDIHDLGKNLVRMMLSSYGFEVVDLGVDVAPDRYVEVVQTEKPTIAAMSCLLTSAMDEMKIIMRQMQTAGVRDRVKVIIGGRPVTAEFAEEIGADGYEEDAIGAVTLARSVMTTSTPEDKK